MIVWERLNDIFEEDSLPRKNIISYKKNFFNIVKAMKKTTKKQHIVSYEKQHIVS